MLEWLVTLGAAELREAIFEQVLKLEQVAAEDYVKDFFKGCSKSAPNDPDEQLREWAEEKLKMQNDASNYNYLKSIQGKKKWRFKNLKY